MLVTPHARAGGYVIGTGVRICIYIIIGMFMDKKN